MSLVGVAQDYTNAIPIAELDKPLYIQDVMATQIVKNGNVCLLKFLIWSIDGSVVSLS